MTTGGAVAGCAATAAEAAACDTLQAFVVHWLWIVVIAAMSACGPAA